MRIWVEVGPVYSVCVSFCDSMILDRTYESISLQLLNSMESAFYMFFHSIAKKHRLVGIIRAY